MKLVCEVLLLLTITLSLQGVRSEKLNCTRSDLQPACVCTTSKGTVDLTPLSSDIGPKYVRAELFRKFSNSDGPFRV